MRKETFAAHGCPCKPKGTVCKSIYNVEKTLEFSEERMIYFRVI